MLFIHIFFVGFTVSEIPRVSVLGYFFGNRRRGSVIGTCIRLLPPVYYYKCKYIKNLKYSYYSLP